jgi:hypothetical protein
MNYQRIYNNIINRAKSENRQKGCGVYFERHHIIPKCIDGTNHTTNLILLTGREHFIAHKLLCEVYPYNTKLHYALWRMMNPQTKNHKRSYNISSREYDRCKNIQSLLVQELGKQNKNKNLGKQLSVEIKNKISNTLTGHKQTTETIELRRTKLIGNTGWYWKGKSRSVETKEKIRQTMLSKKNKNI